MEKSGDITSILEESDQYFIDRMKSESKLPLKLARTLNYYKSRYDLIRNEHSPKANVHLRESQDVEPEEGVTRLDQAPRELVPLTPPLVRVNSISENEHEIMEKAILSSLIVFKSKYKMPDYCCVITITFQAELEKLAPYKQICKTLPIVGDILSLNSKWYLIPEFTRNGRIHYHGIITPDKANSFKSKTLPLLRRMCGKSLDYGLCKSYSNWNTYIHKDYDTNLKILSCKNLRFTNDNYRRYAMSLLNYFTNDENMVKTSQSLLKVFCEDKIYRKSKLSKQ